MERGQKEAMSRQTAISLTLLLVEFQLEDCATCDPRPHAWLLELRELRRYWQSELKGGDSKTLSIPIQKSNFNLVGEQEFSK